MLLGPLFRSTFVFSINSLILFGFLLTFHLAEASLFAFLWLSTLVCAIVQKYHKFFLFKINHIFITHFAINLFYLLNLET